MGPAGGRAQTQDSGAHRYTLVRERVAAGVHAADWVGICAPNVLTTIEGIGEALPTRSRDEVVSWTLHPVSLGLDSPLGLDPPQPPPCTYIGNVTRKSEGSSHPRRQFCPVTPIDGSHRDADELVGVTDLIFVAAPVARERYVRCALHRHGEVHKSAAHVPACQGCLEQLRVRRFVSRARPCRMPDHDRNQGEAV